MKALCPKNETHKEFFTVAHVVQTWKVDEEGEFIEEISTDETTHGPTVGNIWECAVCGTEAKSDRSHVVL